MRRVTLMSMTIALLMLPGAAFAQRQPAEGAVSVGGAFGAFLPTDDAFSNAPYFEGQFQFNLTPRLGVRFGVGFTDTDIRPETDDSLRQIRLGADLLYNWEHGEWHPYVGAGFGAHLLQFKENGNDFGDGETKLGGAVLGGIEYFFTRDAVITGEFRYQFVDDFNSFSPSGVLLAAGVKKYF